MSRFLIAAVLAFFVTAPVVSHAKVAVGHTQVGHASYYGKKFHGRTTANGERFNMNAMTAAHKTLPLGTKVRVTRVDTGNSIVVRINDRGPFIKGRIIDLSKGAARKLGMIQRGVSEVKVEVLSRPKRRKGT